MGSIFAPLIRVHRVEPKTPSSEDYSNPPSPQPSSPLLKGGEGTSASEKPLRCAEQGWLMYTLIRNHAGEAIFRTPSFSPLTSTIKIEYNRNASDHQERERADRGCTQPSAPSPFENPLDTF
jgi:hypothetical protein